MRKLFIDTANLHDISSACKRGIISGVTTNPSLMSKERKGDYAGHMQRIAEICKKNNNIPLSVEVFATDQTEILEQALQLQLDIGYDNLNIKIPVGFDELETINNLATAGVRVNCTCCFTTSQLTLAAAAGARYVSFFYNRAKDSGENEIRTLTDTSQFIKVNGLDCEIIAGSIRTPKDITNAWTYGAHIVTAGYNVIKEGTTHPGTQASVDQFLTDFKEWIN
jgi:transaldolase